MRPELGIENGQLTPCPTTPNCVSSQATDDKHYIEPIVTSGTTSMVKNRLLGVLEQFPRSKVVMAEDHYIRSEFTSKIFRFVDDVEFYFPATQSSQMTVHVRSASRIGRSDLGVNRKRVEEIRSKFHAIDTSND